MPLDNKTDISDDVVAACVWFLLDDTPKTFWPSLRCAIKEDPEKWWAKGGWHFTQGMYFRNRLREVVKDDQLPSGNWDDYYIEVLEQAAEMDRVNNLGQR